MCDRKEGNTTKTEKEVPTYVEKWMYTLYTTLIAIAVFNPWTYRLTNRLLYSLTGPLAKGGCPTEVGFGVHMVVFTLILRVVMGL
jgi:hypothetical protein